VAIVLPLGYVVRVRARRFMGESEVSSGVLIDALAPPCC